LLTGSLVGWSARVASYFCVRSSSSSSSSSLVMAMQFLSVI
jgi:hypothetical protein